MTDLSVVIVSYNVRAFLEQCLVSVERPPRGLTWKWVVDNKSVDGSVDMVRRRFPWVKLIANEDNVGFPWPTTRPFASLQASTRCF